MLLAGEIRAFQVEREDWELAFTLLSIYLFKTVSKQIYLQQKMGYLPSDWLLWGQEDRVEKVTSDYENRRLKT